MGDAGDFWLSDSPAHSSKAWGASLPRVATWARFTTVLNGMPLKQHEFVVLNAHLDHASETARVESARLLRTKAHELSQKSQCNKETGLGSEDSKHGRSSDSSDSSDSSSSCSTSVVFVMGDFNAVKDEGGKRGWYAQLTADASKNSDSDSTPPLIDAWAQASERNCGACSQVLRQARVELTFSYSVALHFQSGCSSSVLISGAILFTLMIYFILSHLLFRLLCLTCFQSTFHAWRGSSEPSPNWLAPYFGHRSLEIAASGARHIDGVFVTQSAVVKAEKSREVSSDAPTSTDATGAEEQEDARESRRDGDPDDSPHGTILKAKLVTDDKRRRNSRYGQPFASDHYPVVVTYQWFRQDGEGARNGLIDRPGVNSGTGYEL